MKVILLIGGLLVACGGGGGSAVQDADDVQIDAEVLIDGGPDATALGTVHVRVFSPYGQAVEGAHVVHHGPDGSVLGEMLTPASGELDVPVTLGDGITVVRDYLGRPEAWTWLAVAPGDQLTTGAPAFVPPPQPFGFAVAYAQPFTGATLYRTESACPPDAGQSSDPTMPTAYALQVPCSAQAGPVPVIAHALGAGGAPLAWSVVPAAAVPGNGLVSLNMPAWQTTFDDSHVTVVNLPGDDTIVLPRGAVEVEHGDMIEPLPALGADSADFKLVPSLGARVIAVAIQHLFGDRSARNVVVRRTSGDMPDLPLDVSVDYLPELVFTQTVPGAEAARPTLRAMTLGDASLAAADGQLFTFYWYVNDQFDTHRWTFIAPPGTTELVVPALPASLADFPPAAGQELNRPVAAAFAADSLPGYRAFIPLLTEVPTPNRELELARRILPAGDFTFQMSVSTASPI
jgi:hypothetical protein